jgi:hypothetical protein
MSSIISVKARRGPHLYEPPFVPDRSTRTRSGDAARDTTCRLLQLVARDRLSRRPLPPQKMTHTTLFAGGEAPRCGIPGASVREPGPILRGPWHGLGARITDSSQVRFCLVSEFCLPAAWRFCQVRGFSRRVVAFITLRIMLTL